MNDRACSLFADFLPRFVTAVGSTSYGKGRSVGSYDADNVVLFEIAFHFYNSHGQQACCL